MQTNDAIALAFMAGWACAIIAEVFIEKISNQK
jgi:hypothetical protein